MKTVMLLLYVVFVFAVVKSYASTPDQDRLPLANVEYSCDSFSNGDRILDKLSMDAFEKLIAGKTTNFSYIIEPFEIIGFSGFDSDFAPIETDIQGELFIEFFDDRSVLTLGEWTSICHIL